MKMENNNNNTKILTNEIPIYYLALGMVDIKP
jgi:hypothetical protein